MQTRLRTLGLAAVSLAGLASAPAAHAFDVWAVNTANELVRYDHAAPGSVLSTSGITGLSDVNAWVTDITFANGSLYALDNNANLYTLNRATGAATLVSATFAPAGYDLGLASDPFLAGGLRIVTDAGENFSATLGGVFTAGPAAFVGSGDAHAGASLGFSGLAIDPDFGTGYAFDAALDTLFVTYDANFAEFFTVGALGGDFTALASLDFVDGSTLIAALSTDANTSSLYTINTTTGAATLIGSFGGGIQAVAVAPGAIPEPSSFAALAGLAGLGLAASRRRRAA